MTARGPSCPSCGAPATGLERACGYCQAPVATVRCAGCFRMNSPDFTRCAGCGRALGLPLAFEASPFSCPRCEAPLDAFGASSGRLHDCARCGGQLVEHGLLRDLMERTEICGALVQRILNRAAAPADRVRYLPCPECRALMNRTNFGVHSGVIVDVCARHGIWFDAGELPKVLDFIESGGLQRARRRQLEEVAQSKRDVRAARVRAEVEAVMSGKKEDDGPALPRVFDARDASVSHSSPPAWKAGLWDDAREAAAEMLEGLTKLVRRN